ncbi:MAG: SGNH/GDSL hydrolase family protein [Cyclobacteriaceae bacterium]
MKTRIKILTLLSVIALVTACEKYELPVIGEPTSGETDFSKLIVVGNSVSAGYMNGALYVAGQNNSFPSLIASKMALAGGGSFNQPNLAETAVNGCFNPTGGCSLGRLYLKIVNGSPTPTPKTPGNLESLAPYAGDKAALNNFSVPGLTIQTALAPQTGGPATANPFFNPYYARFASNPGVSTVIGDAAAAMANGGTFFLYSLGSNDVLGYATGGASNSALLTSEAAFSASLNAGIGALLNANPDANGAIANIPDVIDLPFFNLVPFAPVPLDASTVTALSTNFGPYNALLSNLIANRLAFGITEAQAAELEGRKLSFQVTTNSATTNKIMITDETLFDLEPYLTALVGLNSITPAQKLALQPYRRIRHTRSTDKINLTTSSVIGAVIENNPQFINGVSVPLGWTTTSTAGADVSDPFLLIPSEQTEIKNRIAAFNSIIGSYVQTYYGDPIVLVDLYNAFKNVYAGTATYNGSSISSSIAPPFGVFSLDGVHPNARGNGYVANQYIDAINKRWNSQIPQVDVNSLPGNELPIP